MSPAWVLVAPLVLAVCAGLLVSRRPDVSRHVLVGTGLAASGVIAGAIGWRLEAPLDLAALMLVYGLGVAVASAAVYALVLGVAASARGDEAWQQER